MARRTLKVRVPVGNTEEFSKLLNDIRKQHLLLGEGSPLNGDTSIDMAAFIDSLEVADDLKDEGDLLKAQSEEKIQQAKNIYGTSKGQGVETPGTLYNKCDVIKKKLLLKYRGNEEALSSFGFDVVIGLAKGRKAKVVAE